MIADIDTLVAYLETQRDRTIVSTNGVFDILHTGHVRYLEEAKKLGDILVVALNTDDSVKANKGPTRPFRTTEDRAEVIAALRAVDHVTFFDERTPSALLEKLRPTIHVKGGDYRMEDIIEREVVERHGGTVVLLGKIDCLSTTDIAEKIAASGYQKTGATNPTITE